MSAMTKIAALSRVPRAVLVSIVCYGLSHVSTAKNGAIVDIWPVPMSKSEIWKSYTRMIEVQRKSEGVEIGYDVSEESVRDSIAKLIECGLIMEGVKIYGRVKTSRGSGSDEVK